MTKYIYFISYRSSGGGIGRLEVFLTDKITSLKHVEHVEQLILEQLNINAVVTNFIFLRKEKFS